VILLCVRWYLVYNLSLRNLEEMMAERGISVDHTTIHRWIVRYSPELLKRFNAHKRTVTAKWHVDETTSRSEANGNISIAPSTAMATGLNSGSVPSETSLRPNGFCAKHSSGMAGPNGS
jgi:hypothetical protein